MMAETIKDWYSGCINKQKNHSSRWLSEDYFFRDPMRPMHKDLNYFFSPADGIILYQKIVEPDGSVFDIKSKSYTIKEALRDYSYDKTSLIIGIFLTLYDVHINRIPYDGHLTYKILPSIETHNRAMPVIEESLQYGHIKPLDDIDYLFTNQRMLNKIFSPKLNLSYYILQIADYDTETMLPFELNQSYPVKQNERFSQIRFGSQVDLIIPLSEEWDFEVLLPDYMHVLAGIDPLIKIKEKK